MSRDNIVVGHNFPAKLHYALSEIESDGLGHIVSWQPHGRCFMVHKKEEFEQKILPSWFRQSKLTSFQRQLNIYSFQRLTSGPDKNAYYHELFLRGKPLLARKIQRQMIKGQGPRKRSVPDTEPNFYAMASLPDENHHIDNMASKITPKHPQVVHAVTTGVNRVMEIGPTPTSEQRPLAPVPYLPLFHDCDPACNPLLVAASRGLGRFDYAGRPLTTSPFPFFSLLPYIATPFALTRGTTPHIASVIEEAIRVTTDGPCRISSSLRNNRDGRRPPPIPPTCYRSGNLSDVSHAVSDFIRSFASQECDKKGFTGL